MSKKWNKVLAFLLALALVVTTFGSDFASASVYAAEEEQQLDETADEAVQEEPAEEESLPEIFESLDEIQDEKIEEVAPAVEPVAEGDEEIVAADGETTAVEDAEKADDEEDAENVEDDEDAEEEELEEELEEEVEEVAEEANDYVFDESKDTGDGIVVTLHAENNVIPEGSYFTVTRLSSGEEEQIKNTIDALDEETTVVGTYSYDITIYAEDGSVIEPENGSVQVTFSNVSVSSDDIVDVYHTEVSDGNVQVEEVDSSVSGSEVVFDAPHFSVYTVIVKRHDFLHPVTTASAQIYLYDTKGNEIGSPVSYTTDVFADWKVNVSELVAHTGLTGRKFVGAYYLCDDSEFEGFIEHVIEFATLGIVKWHGPVFKYALPTGSISVRIDDGLTYCYWLPTISPQIPWGNLNNGKLVFIYKAIDEPEGATAKVKYHLIFPDNRASETQEYAYEIEDGEDKVSVNIPDNTKLVIPAEYKAEGFYKTEKLDKKENNECPSTVTIKKDKVYDVYVKLAENTRKVNIKYIGVYGNSEIALTNGNVYKKVANDATTVSISDSVVNVGAPDGYIITAFYNDKDLTEKIEASELTIGENDTVKVYAKLARQIKVKYICVRPNLTNELAGTYTYNYTPDSEIPVPDADKFTAPEEFSQYDIEGYYKESDRILDKVYVKNPYTDGKITVNNCNSCYNVFVKYVEKPETVKITYNAEDGSDKDPSFVKFDVTKGQNHTILEYEDVFGENSLPEGKELDYWEAKITQNSCGSGISLGVGVEVGQLIGVAVGIGIGTGPRTSTTVTKCYPGNTYVANYDLELKAVLKDVKPDYEYVSVYATHGTRDAKVNDQLKDKLKLYHIQDDSYYPVGVIKVPTSFFEGKSGPYYITSEADYAVIKDALSTLDVSYLINNGTQNKDNLVVANKEYVDWQTGNPRDSVSTALFDWGIEEHRDKFSNGKANIALHDNKFYKYHLDLKFVTYDVNYKGVYFENGVAETAPVDLTTDSYLKNYAITHPSMDSYKTYNKNQYAFVEFYKDKECTKVFDVKTATKNETVYAKFDRTTYTVTYTDGVAGVEVFKDKVISGLKAGDPTPAFTDKIDRTGYDFIGWKDANGVAPTETVSGNATYIAQWKAKNYTVSYTILNEKFKKNEPADESAAFDSTYTVAGAPAKEAGYDFKGWTLNEEDVEDVTKAVSEIKINGPVELYGKYVPSSGIAYVVNYYTQNGDDDEYTIRPEATINATGTTDTVVEFSRANDKFVGYHYAKTMVGDEEVTDFSTIKVLGNGSLVVDVFYDADEYMVTYAYDGTVPEKADPTADELNAEPYTRKYRVGQTVKIADDATAPGYTFSGWLATLSGTGSDITVTEDNEVRPVQVADRIAGIVRAFRDLVVKSETTDDGTVRTFKMPASNVLVSGSFTQDHYTVTYIYKKDKEGVSGETEEASYVFENKVYGDATPTFSAYTVPTGMYFVGWLDEEDNLVQNKDIADTIVTKSLTFVAKYNDKNKIHIVIKGQGDDDNKDTTLPYNGTTQTADMNFTVEVHVNGEIVNVAKVDSATLDMLLASLDSVKNFGTLTVYAFDGDLENLDIAQDEEVEYIGEEQAIENTVISQNFDLDIDGETKHYTVEVELGGGQGKHVNAEGYPIVVEDVRVTCDGENVNDQFEIDIHEGDVVGHLYITKAKLKVTTGSASKVYDGTALTKDEASIDGLQGGEVAEIHATGSQTEVGSSTNTYEILWDSELTTALKSDYDTENIDETGLGTLTVNAQETPYNPPTNPDTPGDVLGASRALPPAAPTAPQGDVLGAQRQGAVLGARRGRTDDPTNNAARLIVIVVAAGIALSIMFFGKKKEDEE